MLDALYEDSTAKVLDDRQRMPIQPPRPSPGMFDGILSAAPRGFATAVNESARVVYRAATAGADEVMRRQQQEADDFTAEAIFRRRLELDSERGFVDQQLKAGADYWKPDPQTTGAAAQIVQGFAGAVTKAGIYTAVTGTPIAGAVAAGADIGGTEYLGLRDQGVDAATAAQVAAVRGTSAAAQFALPLAGATLAKTLALAAAGGPIGYIGENAIAREILRHADYGQLADQVDPFDPVGLTAATVGAGLFGVGAYALRRGAALGKPKPQPEPAPKQPDAVPPPQEAVDAALVVAAREQQDARRLSDPVNLKAAAAEDAAIAKAEQQLAIGDPVHVEEFVQADVHTLARLHEAVAADEARLQAEREAQVAAIDTAAAADERTRLADHWPTAEDMRGSTVDPGEAAIVARAAELDASRVERLALEHGDNGAAFMRAIKEWLDGERTATTHTGGAADQPAQTAGRGETGGTAGAERPAGEVVHRTVTGGNAEQGWTGATRIRRADGEPLTVYRGAGRALGAADFEPGALGFATKQPSSGLGVWFALNGGEAGRYGKVEQFQLDLRNPKIIKVEDLPGFNSTAEAIRFREQLQAQGHDGILISAKHLGGPVNLVAFRPEQVIRPGAVEPARATPEPGAMAAGGATPEAAPSVPDVQMLRDDGSPVSAADYLRQIEDEARAETADAGLLQVAAECFLEVG